MPSASKASAEGGAVIDDGCGGACGGVGGLCFEADPEFVKTDERWVYVGQGRGTYSQAASMDYVGHGRGDFEKEKVTVSSGVRFRAVCVFIIGFLLFVIVGLLIYFFMPHFYSPVGADDPCQTSPTMDEMTVIQREACCANGYGAFCATTPKAPVIIHDKFYTNVRTERVAHAVPVPIPGPPAKVITRKVYVKHHPYDCTEGYGNWKTQWSHEHQRYCCYKSGEACVTKAGIRNHYKTITHVHHVTVPEKVVVPAPPPREINHVVKTIVTGVTQHIGHHVHVIHHVHHYTTSSHDVDDLPDIVGDDDASLPPEYRHGGMIVGGDDESPPPEYRHMSISGDDESLPPEYRQGDMSIGGDEESLSPEYRDGSASGDSDGSPPRKLSAFMRGRAHRQ
ncbi:unnamed protein product [Symbiodinium sp. KB8]|nr:unnamed protein product [Symbiodinium sp. KB8]